MLWLIAAIILLVAIICIYYINRIIRLENAIENALAQIDVQLKKRADLVPNLVETVKGYAKHEKELFERIARVRAEMLKASGTEKVRKGNELQRLIKSIFALAEAYPKLKANENFKLLQEQLEGIENKIAAARQFYNDSVLEYNNLVKTFPGVIFAKLLGKKPKEFLEASEAERRPVRVKF